MGMGKDLKVLISGNIYLLPFDSGWGPKDKIDTCSACHASHRWEHKKWILRERSFDKEPKASCLLSGDQLLGESTRRRWRENFAERGRTEGK